VTLVSVGVSSMLLMEVVYQIVNFLYTYLASQTLVGSLVNELIHRLFECCYLFCFLYSLSLKRATDVSTSQPYYKNRSTIEMDASLSKGELDS